MTSQNKGLAKQYLFTALGREQVVMRRSVIYPELYTTTLYSTHCKYQPSTLTPHVM